MKDSKDLLGGICRYLLARKKFWLPHFILTLTITIVLFIYTNSDEIGNFLYGD